MLQLLIKQIIVFPEGRIKIVWNFNDEISAIMQAIPENETGIAV